MTKKTTAELGRRYKAKHPEYKYLSDEDVGRLVKKKHPGVYDDFVDLAMARPRTIEMVRYEPKLTNRTETNVDRLIEHYRPSRGRLSSWWRRGQAEGRAHLLAVLNQEQVLVIQQGAMLEEAALHSRRAVETFKMFLAQNAAALFQLQANAALIEQALSRGRTLQADQQIILEEALSRLRTDEARRASNISVSEHERRTQIDVQARWEQIVQDLDAADLLAISEQQLLKKLRANFNELVRERHQISKGNDPEPVKKRILSRFDKDIDSLERLIDARQARLFLSENGEETRRLKEAPSDG